MSTGLDTIAPIAMAVGYLIYHGLQKAREADQKAEKMVAKDLQEELKADLVEKACASKELEREWWETSNRDKERECVEVLRTILPGRNIKEWDYVYPYGVDAKEKQRTKAQKKEAEKMSDYMEAVSRIIFYANRGKIRSGDIGYICIDRDCHQNWMHEITSWWEEKIRSFGIDHGIWAVYDTWEKDENGMCVQKTYKCRANETGHAYVREYCWDCYPSVVSTKVHRPLSSVKISTPLLPIHHYSNAPLNSEFRMRIATVSEMEALCRAKDVNTSSWCWVSQVASILLDKETKAIKYMGEGNEENGRYTHCYKDCSEYPTHKFLPAFDLVANDAAELQSYQIGEVYLIGTIYMEGCPVRNIKPDPSVSRRPTKYDVASVLELCEPLDDPDYQIFGVYIGNGVFLSRENVLRDMTYSDIVYALEKAKERPR